MRKLWVMGVGVLLVCGGAHARAGAQRPVLPEVATGETATLDGVLRAMTAQAGVVFVGTVVEVRRVTPVEGGAGVVEVVFSTLR